MQKNLVIDNAVTNYTLERLENQIKWYQDTSRRSGTIYKLMKFFQIAMAITISAIVHVDVAIIRWIISILGAIIALFESIQYMNQYESIWISHKKVAQLLKREKFLFLAAAGPYEALDESGSLKYLAERVEELVNIE